MAGVFSNTTKTMLKNIIRHTNSHNKVVEEADMWQQHGRMKEMGSLNPSNPSYGHDDRCDVRARRNGRNKYWESRSADRKSYDSWSVGPRHHRAHMDDAEEARGGKSMSQNSTHWMRQLHKLEESDPNRWDHGGFKEMYPKDFESSYSDSSRAGSSDRHKKKKKSSTKKKKRHRSKSTKHKSKARKSSRRRRRRTSNSSETNLSSDNNSDDESSRRSRGPKSKKYSQDQSRSRRSLSRDSSTSDSISSEDRSHKRRHRSKKHHKSRTKSGRRDSASERDSSGSDLSSDDSGRKHRRNYRHKRSSAAHSKDRKKGLKCKSKKKSRHSSKENPSVFNDGKKHGVGEVLKEAYGHASNGDCKQRRSLKRRHSSEDTSDSSDSNVPRKTHGK